VESAPAIETSRAEPGIARVVIFGVLLGSYVVNAMDRQLFPLVAPEVRREYGFSLAGVGLLSTVFTLGMAVAGVPTGFLLARFSRRAVLQTGIALFSAGTALTVVSRGFADMLLYRTVTGVGEAMQLTVLLAIAANYFAGHRAAALGAVNFSFALGAILGPMLGGALLGAYGSWQVPMAVFGVLGFAAMAVIAGSVDSSSTEQDRAVARHADDGGAATLANRNTILLTVVSLLGGLVIYGYLGLYPTFLRERLGYSPAAAGSVMGVYGLGALMSIAGGWIGDRGSPRLVLGAAFAAAAMLGYLLFRFVLLAGGVVLRVGRRRQRRRLREPGWLSRQGRATRTRRPRVGRVRHQPLPVGGGRGVLDGMDREPCGMGSGRLDPDFVVLPRRRGAGIGVAGPT